MADDVLLVAVDFTGGANEVVEQAVVLATRLGARVVLQHAVQLPTGVEPRARVGLQTALQALITDAERELGRLSEVFVRAGVQVSTRVDPGQAVKAILDAARSEHPMMIILGTHGRTGLARAVLGSVAEEVLRHADVPVLTIRALHPSAQRTQTEERISAEADG